MSIYDIAGSHHLTLSGWDNYESILAVSRDRIYRANISQSLVQIYGFDGTLYGSVSVPPAAMITCMGATDSKLYVVTTDSYYSPYGGQVHVFSRDAVKDTYLLIKTANTPIDSWFYACSVDRGM